MKLNTAIAIALAAMTTTALAAPHVTYANTTEAVAVAPKLTPVKGNMIYSDGKRLGQVFRVDKEGNAQIVLNGKRRKVPNETLVVEDGQLATTLSREEVLANKG